MQATRDSSVWRSLAVAFGDGLAFGVGMKLTQPARSTPAPAAPAADLSPVARRLEQVEQRLSEVERTPRALAPPPERRAAQPFDQKVLEAVVNALDTRLHEHTAQVERQIGDLQQRVTAELKTLHDQDRSIAGGLESHLAELQEQFAGQLAAIRHSVEAERLATEEQLAGLRREVSGALNGQLEKFQQQIREEVRQAVGNVAAMAASAADSAIEDRMAPLRIALEARDREVAELRARLAGSDQATLDLLYGVGEICRRAAERYVAPQAEQPPQEPPAAEPPPPEPEANSFADEFRKAGGTIEPPPDPPREEFQDQSEESVPGFAQSASPGKLWRVPLVSSLIFTTGLTLALHYLHP